MSASLVEMISAIALLGIIAAGALVPVTHTVVTYQDAEADLCGANAEFLAAHRISQIANTTWRHADAPADLAPLTQTSQHRLAVGTWDLRYQNKQLHQTSPAATATLVDKIDNFALTYRLADGRTESAPNAAERAGVIAANYRFTTGGRTWIGSVAPADIALHDRLLTLPAHGADVTTYRRADFEREHAFNVQPWE